MSRFLVLLRDDPSGFAGLSPAEMQAIIEKYIAWGARLQASGHLLMGGKLVDGAGRVMRGATPVISDGPFVETREIVGGAYLLQARDYDEATALLADSPHLAFGSIEVRQIDDVSS
jgi:hypothetical protein